MKNILVIKGHPKEDSFCNSLTDSYVKGLLKAGNKVKVLDLRYLNLDRFIYFDHTITPDFPLDLIKTQKLMSWADCWVFSYPIWWATAPALVKLFLETMLTSGFAFKYTEPKYGFIPQWEKLLKGKTARLIVTLDSPTFYYKLFLKDPNFKMMKANLNFCGIDKIDKNYFGSIKLSSLKKKQKWIEEIYKVGLKEK